MQDSKIGGFDSEEQRPLEIGEKNLQENIEILYKVESEDEDLGDIELKEKAEFAIQEIKQEKEKHGDDEILTKTGLLDRMKDLGGKMKEEQGEEVAYGSKQKGNLKEKIRSFKEATEKPFDDYKKELKRLFLLELQAAALGVVALIPEKQEVVIKMKKKGEKEGEGKEGDKVVVEVLRGADFAIDMLKEMAMSKEDKEKLIESLKKFNPTPDIPTWIVDVSDKADEVNPGLKAAPAFLQVAKLKGEQVKAFFKFINDARANFDEYRDRVVDKVVSKAEEIVPKVEAV